MRKEPAGVTGIGALEIVGGGKIVKLVGSARERHEPAAAGFAGAGLEIESSVRRAPIIVVERQPPIVISRSRARLRIAGGLLQPG